MFITAIAFLIALFAGHSAGQPFSCPADGNYPNPLDCTAYYYCWNSEPYIQFCPSGQYFNAVSRKCEDGVCTNNGTVTPTNLPPISTTPTISSQGTTSGIPTTGPITTTVSSISALRGKCASICANDTELVKKILKILCMCPFNHRNQTSSYG